MDSRKLQPNHRDRASVVTSMGVHCAVVKPVVEQLLRRKWDVRLVHVEGIWQKVESFLAKRKKRPLASFYVKPSRKPQRRINVLANRLISKAIFYSVSVLRMDKPQIMIVMTESTMPTKVVALVGKSLGIPILVLLQLGMLGPNYECPEFLADNISVPGEFIRDLLINCGVDESRVVVTGRPTYDALIRAGENFKKEDICRRLGLDPTRALQLQTTSYRGNVQTGLDSAALSFADHGGNELYYR